MKRCLTSAALLFASALPGTLVVAAEADRSQPIEVQADRSRFDELKGRQTHTGDVLITQGSLRIEADEIIIHLTKGALSGLDASGAPVAFRQLDENGLEVRASSHNMRYEVDNGLLLLTGSAKLSQPGRELSGERIEYHVDSQAVSAEGGQGEQSERVKIVIQPAPAQ